MLAETVSADTLKDFRIQPEREEGKKIPKMTDFNKSTAENPIRNDAKLTT